jgi:hypothetical protein
MLSPTISKKKSYIYSQVVNIFTVRFLKPTISNKKNHIFTLALAVLLGVLLTLAVGLREEQV